MLARAHLPSGFGDWSAFSLYRRRRAVPSSSLLPHTTGTRKEKRGGEEKGKGDLGRRTHTAVGSFGRKAHDHTPLWKEVDRLVRRERERGAKSTPPPPLNLASTTFLGFWGKEGERGAWGARGRETKKTRRTTSRSLRAHGQEEEKHSTSAHRALTAPASLLHTRTTRTRTAAKKE